MRFCGKRHAAEHAHMRTRVPRRRKSLKFVLKKIVFYYWLNIQIYILNVLEKGKMSFNEILIEMVRDSPNLYDSKDKYYKDQIKIDSMWTKISSSTGQPVEICTKRWKSLRDRFSKERKNIENMKKSGAALTTVSVWEHYESLTIILDTKCKYISYNLLFTSI
ncbi:transcription factor Adf-1-like [Ciona intestinalis]